MLTVFRNALRLSSDPALALRAGQRMHVTAYGMYGYALLSSPTHAAAVDFAIKYHRVMGPVADISFSQEEGAASLTYEPVLSLDPTEDLYRFAMEFQFSSHRTLNKDLYGSSFEFSGVRAAYAAPAHARFYTKIFKCPVLFNQARNELTFDTTWMSHPMVIRIRLPTPWRASCVSRVWSRSAGPGALHQPSIASWSSTLGDSPIWTRWQPNCR